MNLRTSTCGARYEQRLTPIAGTRRRRLPVGHTNDSGFRNPAVSAR